MKKFKTIIYILIFGLTSNILIAQNFDLTPFYGYQMNGGIEFYEGELSVENAQFLGGTFDIMVMEGMGVRLMYSYTKTPAEFRPHLGYETAFPGRKFDLINDYYQIGVIKGVVKGKAEPYGVLTMGATRFKAEGDGVSDDDRVKFAMTLGAGLKIFLSDRIGLKFEGAMMMPIYFQGVSFYFGTGGTGAGVSGAVPLFQGNFNGGIVFRFAKSTP
jgi:hypothetical protein